MDIFCLKGEVSNISLPFLTRICFKGAINILTKNMALDLAAFKIRVNSVSPGWIWSPEVAKAADFDR